jgi:hypothetical protein
MVAHASINNSLFVLRGKRNYILLYLLYRIYQKGLTMGTPIGSKRKTPRKPLQRKISLKRTKGLNKQSKRAKVEMKTWIQIKKERMANLNEKFGYVPCEYCKIATDSFSEIYTPEAHHNDQNRRNCTAENARILHRYCNQLIEDKNIKELVPSLLDN